MSKNYVFDKLTDIEKGQADEEQALVAVCRYSRAPVLKKAKVPRYGDA
ncbi:MAG: hypothetical protein Q8865_07770 [Bacillota bacterium]|nr:hypothetical protein [Bacillota bacterium]